MYDTVDTNSIRKLKKHVKQLRKENQRLSEENEELRNQMVEVPEPPKKGERQVPKVDTCQKCGSHDVVTFQSGMYHFAKCEDCGTKRVISKPKRAKSAQKLLVECG